MTARTMYFCVTTLILSLGISCGSSEYVEYDGPAAIETNSGETDSTCSETALAAYTSQIATAVDGTCANCHATISALTLTSGDHANNRTALSNFANLSADTLNNYLASGGGHPGGPQTSTLPPSQVEEWITAELACTSQ